MCYKAHEDQRKIYTWFLGDKKYELYMKITLR